MVPGNLSGDLRGWKDRVVSDQRPDRLTLLFPALTGGQPEGVWRAPGRVNLIGEHTDYNDGWALPFAIDRDLLVAVRRRGDRQVRCWSSAAGSGGVVTSDVGGTGPLASWARYPIGVVWAFDQAGYDPPGMDIVIDSSVPAGRGLASSAALEAAVAVAINDLGQLGLDRLALARLCHRAESEFVGAPVGLLDQLAVLLGGAGQGLLIDFRSLEMAPLPLEVGPLVVVDTHVRHHNASGGYASRRRECQEAAAAMDVATLRGASLDQVGGLSGDLQRRARHVVTENLRVVMAADRLRSGIDIGELMYESHISLRDDFAVSCAELDAVVETARSAGARGARLTGAGFGGCAIVLGLDVEVVDAAMARRFKEMGLPAPGTFAAVPSAGAGRLA
jgi:galactokinase